MFISAAGSDAATGGNLPPRESWADFRKLPLTDAEFQTIASNVAPYMHFTLEAPNQHRKLHQLGVSLHQQIGVSREVRAESSRRSFLAPLPR